MKILMNLTDWKNWIEIFLLFVLLMGLAIPLGRYIAKVYQKQAFGSVERIIYKLTWINPLEQMSWQAYAKSVVLLGGMSFLLLYILLRLQYYLPFNPQNYSGVKPGLAFNIAISFSTNTNWQSYEGEKVLSYFSQMMGLSVQNFISAATGMAVAAAFVRGLVHASEKGLGNFWVDLTRSILYILLPLSIIMALLLCSQGVVQNFNHDVNMVAGGPVASQVAIAQLASGGGFFGANAAHPFANPTPFSNFLQLLGLLLIPVSFIIAYGRMICQPKESRALLWMLFTVFILGFIFCAHQELNHVVLNYEGKEYRHGVLNSVLWAVATTATSNGSTNALIECFSPLAGMVPLLFMLTGEVIFGGLGEGLYILLLYVLISVFLAGLMVGRMPEYLGKKIEVFEVKMSILAILLPSLIILIFFSIVVQMPITLGERGFTKLLYAFASTTNNNGSAFAGLNSNTTFLNIIFAITMLLGRYGVMIPVLAIAGSLILKSRFGDLHDHLEKESVLSTDTTVFMILICMVILLISLLSFFPVILLGPISEHLSGAIYG